MPAQRTAAIGFKPHTGRAAAVALAGPAAKAEIVLKRHIEIAATFDEGAVYHVAQKLPLAEAEAWVRASEERLAGVARSAVASIVAELRERGLSPVASVVVGGGRGLPPLEGILKSHALVHAAEGELYRTLVARASEGCGVPASFVPAKELASRAAQALAIPDAEVRSTLAALGKASGRPWTADEKESSLAAWIALAAARPR